MLAAVFLGALQVEAVRVPDPQLRSPSDAIVRILAAGVCGSDLWYYSGIKLLEEGARLGHELVGTVEAIGEDVHSVRIGDLVVSPFSYGDGTCAQCLAGLPTSCENVGYFGGDSDPGGAQADAVRVPYADANLVALPTRGADPESLRRYLPLADVLPTGHHAAVSAQVGPCSSVAVVGDGAVGLCAVLAARALGAEDIVLLGHHPERVALARRWGAREVSTSQTLTLEGVKELVEQEWRGGATSVLECVGTQDSVDAALAAARDGGTVATVGLPVTGATISLAATFDRNIRIAGGVTPVRRYLPDLLDKVAAGLLDTSPLFGHEVPLSAIDDAYRAMQGRTAIKSIVIPN